MKRVFGIETEYGITIDGAESVDVVTESIELVRSYTSHGLRLTTAHGPATNNPRTMNQAVRQAAPPTTPGRAP